MPFVLFNNAKYAEAMDFWMHLMRLRELFEREKEIIKQYREEKLKRNSIKKMEYERERAKNRDEILYFFFLGLQLEQEVLQCRIHGGNGETEPTHHCCNL